MDTDLKHEILGEIHKALELADPTAVLAELIRLFTQVYEHGRADQRYEAAELFRAFGEGFGSHLVEKHRPPDEGEGDGGGDGGVLDVRDDGPPPDSREHPLGMF